MPPHDMTDAERIARLERVVAAVAAQRFSLAMGSDRSYQRLVAQAREDAQALLNDSLRDLGEPDSSA